MPVPYFGGRQVVSRLGRGLARRAAMKFARSAASWSAREAARLSRSTYRTPGVVTRNRIRGIKQTVMRMKETHFVDYNYGKTELYHNMFLGAFLQSLNDTTRLPSQGDGDSNRTGNDIYARGIQVKMQFGLKQDRHNTTFRVLVFKTTKGYNVGGSYTNVFDNQTGNVMLDAIDKDRVTVLLDKRVSAKPINPSPDGKEITLFRKYWIPHKSLYKFYDDGLRDNSYPYDIVMLVVAYDAYGSLTTDNIGYVQAWSRFYFKDK